MTLKAYAMGQLTTDVVGICNDKLGYEATSYKTSARKQL